MISLPSADRKHIYRHLWQPLQSGPCILVFILPIPEGWKAEWTLAGKKVTQIIQPSTRPGIEPGSLGLGDRDLTTAPTPPLYTAKYTSFNHKETSLKAYVYKLFFFKAILHLVSPRNILVLSLNDSKLFTKHCCKTWTVPLRPVEISWDWETDTCRRTYMLSLPRYPGNRNRPVNRTL